MFRSEVLKPNQVKLRLITGHEGYELAKKKALILNIGPELYFGLNRALARTNVKKVS